MSQLQHSHQNPNSQNLARRILQLALFNFFFTFLAGCGGNNSDSLPHKPLVLVSVAPYQYFVERICGSYLNVRSIVPQGMNAHTYESPPRQMDDLKHARIWFRIGEGFEMPLLDILRGYLHVIDLRDGIELIDSELSPCSCSADKDHFDRHIWMSPKLASIQVKALTRALSQQFPALRAEFERNLEPLLEELSALDEELRVSLTPLKGKSLLVAHPAFTYFCRDFHLQQLSIEFEGKEPRPRRLDSILQIVSNEKPAAIIALPQHNSKGAQMVARKLEMPIKIIDPYSHDYFGSMRELAAWITINDKH